MKNNIIKMLEILPPIIESADSISSFYTMMDNERNVIVDIVAKDKEGKSISHRIQIEN